MKTMVSNLGFDADQLFRAILSHEVARSDHLLLLRPEDEDPRGSRTLREVEGMVDRMYGNMKTRVRVVDPRNFEGAVTEIQGEMEKSRGDLFVNLSGGDRALLVAMTVASMFSSKEPVAVSTYSDAFLEEVPVTLPGSAISLEGLDKRILDRIAEGPSTCSEISQALQVSESTVSRRLSGLEGEGFVKRTVQGRTRPVRLTFKGRLVTQSSSM